MNGKQLKNSILQWAIQGRLVPQDPNDEPASVLLERIRAEKARLVKEGKIKKDKNESIIFRGDDNSYYEKFLATGEVKCIDDELPFEIPEGWAWARINAIGISQLGKTLDRGKDFGKEYPYLCSINVYWDGIDLSKIKTFKLRDDELARYKLQKGDLLICEGGDYGRCCIWNRDEDMYYQNALHRVRFYGGLISFFYKYVFELYRNIGYVVGQGQTIKHFTYESMKSILFPVPSISEQKRIVSRIEEIKPIVKKYGRTEETLKRLNADIFDKLKKSVLQEAIQGKLLPQDPADEPASVLLERIREEKQRLLKEGKLKKKDITDSVIFKGEDNKYYEKIGNETVCIDEEIPFDIPHSWSWTRLQSICKITNGFTPLRSEDRFWKGGSINWFTVDDIHEQGEYITETKQRITQEATSEERIVRAGSVLLCCTASIGQCAITRIATTTNQQFNALTIKDEYRDILDDEYLFIFAKTLKDELNRLAGTTTFAFVSVKKVGNILIPIPPIIEQKRIVDIVKKSISVLRENRK